MGPQEDADPNKPIGDAYDGDKSIEVKPHFHEWASVFSEMRPVAQGAQLDLPQLLASAVTATR